MRVRVATCVGLESLKMVPDVTLKLSVEPFLLIAFRPFRTKLPFRSDRSRGPGKRSLVPCRLSVMKMSRVPAGNEACGTLIVGQKTPSDVPASGDLRRPASARLSAGCFGFCAHARHGRRPNQRRMPVDNFARLGRVWRESGQGEESVNAPHCLSRNSSSARRICDPKRPKPVRVFSAPTPGSGARPMWRPQRESAGARLR